MKHLDVEGMPSGKSCSSQEEHVLKLMIMFRKRSGRKLLLARGACIETPAAAECTAPRTRCSSQEEHVLKRSMSDEELLEWRCSSQEEHVLKLVFKRPSTSRKCCSSQEEHVLKQHVAFADY